MLELRIKRSLGYVCPDCDAKPRYYRMLLDGGYWVTYSICRGCGHMFNFRRREDSELAEANKWFAVCRELARSFLISGSARRWCYGEAD